MNTPRDPLAGLSADQRRALLAELLAKKAAAEALPQAIPAPQDHHAPFPLTELQQAYMVGGQAGLSLGGVDCHVTIQIAARGLDPARLERAWLDVVARHEMLRAVIGPDGQHQRVLEQLPAWHLPVEDLRALPLVEAEARVARHGASVESRRCDPQRWPLFDLRLFALPDGRQALCTDFNLLMLDAASTLALFRAWGRVYGGEVQTPALDLWFRDYVLARAEVERGPAFSRAKAAWSERLPQIPSAPDLGLRAGTSATRRLEAVLDAPRWATLRRRAQEAGLTPSGLLAAAFAQVLARFAAAPQFTLTLTLFDRLPLHPKVGELAGEFTSTLLLAVDGSDGPFLERARAVGERLRADLAHALYSGVQVQRDLSQLQGRSVQFPVVFTSTLGSPDEGEPWAWAGRLRKMSSQTPQVALDHQIFQYAGALHTSWDLMEALFPPGLPDAMFAAYRDLLERLVDADWAEPLGPLLPAAQIQARVAENQSGAPVSPGLLHGPFLAQAAAAPERAAVIAPDRVLDYGELRALSDTLLHTLQRHGVAPGERVAVLLEKGWRQAVAVLAVLRAGGAWLPIEVDLPAARIAALLRDGGARLCITDQAVPEGIAAVSVPEHPGPDAGTDASAHPEDLAYVIYTSGSTGAPKGVMMAHHAALNTVLDINARFGVGPVDRVLALSALGFDLSVYDLFGIWAAGGAVVYPPPGAGRDPKVWSALLASAGVTVWNTVPALLEMLVEHGGLAAAGKLRLALLSGDWIPVTLPDRARAQRPDLRIISLGGATEAAIWSVYHDIDRVDPGWVSVPYGRPLRAQTLHVLDGDLNPRPVGVAGDLFIGGAGLALGYLGAPELSAERFFAHPTTGERLYRTGDRARVLESGELEFLGRLDTQVKLSGHRVELGEIEAVLQRHPAVRAAAVTAPQSPGGVKRLVGYVVSEEDSLALEAWLSEQLPGWMVPRTWVRLDALPLSPNGKVDRGRLPSAAPEPRPAEDAQPGTPTEAALLEMVGALLPGAVLSVSGNLFELGATSVILVALHRRIIATLSPELPLVDLYAAPSVRSLAALIDGASALDADREAAARRGADRRNRFRGRAARPSLSEIED